MSQRFATRMDKAHVGTDDSKTDRCESQQAFADCTLLAHTKCPSCKVALCSECMVWHDCELNRRRASLMEDGSTD